MKLFSFNWNSFNNARQSSKAGNSDISPQVMFGMLGTVATIAFYGFGQQPAGRLDGAVAYQVITLPPTPPPSKTTPSHPISDEPFSYYPQIAGVIVFGLFIVWSAYVGDHIGTVSLVFNRSPRKNALNHAGHEDGGDQGNGDGNDNDDSEPNSPAEDGDGDDGDDDAQPNSPAEDGDISDEEDPEYPEGSPEDPPPPPPPATV
ncbi:hypothetical protein H0H93_016142, partial [Arthromyces matolae]